MALLMMYRAIAKMNKMAILATTATIVMANGNFSMAIHHFNGTFTMYISKFFEDNFVQKW